MTDFAHARRTMVDNQLRTAGITDRRLLMAMGEVPRELFVPGARKPLAYIDEAQPLGHGRRLGAPAPFARLVQLAAIEGSDHVLDLGCASGYSAAVLSKLAASVVAVEDNAALAAEARLALKAAGADNVTLLEEPLARAGAAHGTYDVIVVEGVVDAVDSAILAQLKPEGRLVALVAEPGRVPVAHLFAKSGQGVAASTSFDARLPRLSPPADPGFVF